MTPARAAVHCNEKSSPTAEPRTKLRGAAAVARRRLVGHATQPRPGPPQACVRPPETYPRAHAGFEAKKNKKKKESIYEFTILISAAARCACGHIRAAEPVRPSVEIISIAYAGAGSVASSTALRNAAFSSSAPAWPSRYRIDSKTAPLAATGRGRRRPQRRASAANCIESTSAANAGVETRDAQVHRPRSRRCE